MGLNTFGIGLKIIIRVLCRSWFEAIITQWSLRQTIHQLEDEKAHLHQEIDVTKELQEDLTKNREKYAREKFFMKKPGERVFIIE